MRIFLTGGTGFIGSRLVRYLIKRGDECVVVTRAGQNRWNSELVDVVRADPAIAGDWQENISGVDAVINLAGERIVDPPRRWTRDRKKQLRNSRIDTTKNVVDGILNASAAPTVFLSSSAIGYYGPRGDDEVDETTGPGDDFLAVLASEWEEAAQPAKPKVPVTLLRTGIVLGTKGGALASLLPPFKAGLGGPWGSGRQWWSWIHIADQIGLTIFLMDKKLNGPFNLTAPNPVTVNEFSSALGKTLRRPDVFRVPEFALKAGLGEAAAALLDLQRVVPRRALEAGYEFKFPQVRAALKDLL